MIVTTTPEKPEKIDEENSLATPSAVTVLQNNSPYQNPDYRSPRYNYSHINDSNYMYVHVVSAVSLIVCSEYICIC